MKNDFIEVFISDASSIANCIYTLEDGSVRYLTTYKNDSTLDVQERFQCHASIFINI